MASDAASGPDFSGLEWLFFRGFRALPGLIWCQRSVGLTCERRFYWCSSVFAASGAKSGPYLTDFFVFVSISL